MTGTCLCGAVSVEIEATPAFIHDCNCSLCRKLGGAWGYFSSAGVKTTGQTRSYTREDKPDAGVSVHSCKTCGATTHFTLTEAFKAKHPEADMAGVNMRLFNPDDLNGVEVRYPNGKDWSGEGPFGYRREATTIHENAPW